MSQLQQKVNPETSLIFLHIPKAAGSTLHKVIERQYDSKGMYTIDGLQVQKSIDEFKKLTLEQKQKLRVLKGHMPFGLHKELPQTSTYFTILRDPIERVISHYYYVLRRPEHYLYDRVKNQNLSLQEYVSTGISLELNNGQTRLLSGLNTATENQDCTIEFLDIAKRNLQEYFAVVGLTEKFDDTLILLQKTFGWKLPLYVKENVTKNRRVKEEISSETLETIKQYNSLDIELYKFAQELFENQVNQYKDSFQKDLKTFKLINNQYGNIYSLSRPILNRIKAFSSK